MKHDWNNVSKKVILLAENENDTYIIGKLAQITGVAATKFPGEGYRLEVEMERLVDIVVNRK